MGKKYVVEIGRLERLYKVSTSAKGMPNMTWLSPEVDLTPYTEPDLGQVRKYAYKIGYEKGYRDGVNRIGDAEDKIRKEAYDEGYDDAKGGYENGFENGMIVAWEAARKIIRMPEADLLNLFTECYSAVCTSAQVFLKYDASECIEKIRQYEQRQEEQIQVGDEVINRNKTAVVTEITDRYVRIMYSDGSGYALFSKGVVKTGRHFPEIATILENMRGEQDG